MLLLLVKTYKEYKLYCPGVYGSNTWGMNHQEDLIKKKTKWYTTYWTSGGDYFDDVEYECKLNVVLETNDIDNVIKYMRTHKVEKYLYKILDEYQQIVKDKVTLERWLLSL